MISTGRANQAGGLRKPSTGRRCFREWVYIAPPEEHLLVGPGQGSACGSQLVHDWRSSIDLLFESVAGTYGSRSIGVILSGSNRDGSAGIRTIHEAGGADGSPKAGGG